MEGAFCQVNFQQFSPEQEEANKKADDRRLIQLVRDRRLLYARNNLPVASCHTHVRRLWKEVSKEMGKPVEFVRRKWSHIRASYSRHLRNEIHGAITSKGRTVSRWYLADELEFLREHMATDTRSSPYSSTFPPTMLELDMSDSQPESEPEVKPFLQTPSPAPPTQPAGSCTSLPPADSEETSYFQFFRGLHADYQQLSARKQRQFKRQCLLVLHQLLDEEDRWSEGASAEDAVNQTSEDEDRKPFVAALGAIVPD